MKIYRDQNYAELRKKCKTYLDASLSFAFELEGDKLLFDILFIKFMYSSFKFLKKKHMASYEFQLFLK